MPILSTVDHANRQIDAVAVGPIGLADVQEHLARERQWHSLPYREFIDGRGAGPALSPADVRMIVETLRELSRESTIGRTAVVVSTDYAFGMMRMFEMLIEDIFEFRVFRDEAEARAWLNAKAAGQSS